MITEERKYHFIGELILHRSHVLDNESQPKDDKVNWLFLKLGKQQFSFVYKIENHPRAKYDKPFIAKLAFTMFEVVRKKIQVNHKYELLRGQERIGTLRILNALE